MVADLHCHPILNPYNTQKGIWDYKAPTDDERAAMVNTANITTPFSAKFTQADFTSATKGDVHLIFVSIYPIEHGFMINLLGGDIYNPDDGVIKNVLHESLRFIIKSVLQLATADHLEQVAAKVIMNISGKRYFELSSLNREYYNDVLGEYNYFINQPQKQIVQDSSGIQKEYAIQIVRDYSELKDLLALDDNLVPTVDKNVIAIVFSIEGAHSFGSGQRNTIPDIPFEEEIDMLNDLQDPRTANILSVVTKNINSVKSLNGGEHCPFFVTFSHHFWNQLCGHSMSLAKIMNTAFDQERGVSTGFTELGKAVLRLLLSDKNGKRILIDVKHMSVKGRMWYYQYLKETYWDKGDALPIIASHMGVTGAPLAENPSVNPAKMDQFYQGSGWFNNWDINLSDDEILIIYQSGGLIGFNMDQRILSGNALVQSITRISGNIQNKGTSLLYKSIWAEPVLANILQVAKVIRQANPNATDIWEFITIGSDLDGMIDALDAFCHSEDFKIMRVVLKEKLVLRSRFEPVLQHVDVDMILDNFFYKNSLRFLKKNFNQ